MRNLNSAIGKHCTFFSPSYSLLWILSRMDIGFWKLNRWSIRFIFVLVILLFELQEIQRPHFVAYFRSLCHLFKIFLDLKLLDVRFHNVGCVAHYTSVRAKSIHIQWELRLCSNQHTKCQYTVHTYNKLSY